MSAPFKETVCGAGDIGYAATNEQNLKANDHD